MSEDRLTVVTVPCFSGAPWDLKKLDPLSHRPLRTMRLPEGLDDVEAYADFVAEQVSRLSAFVLVGDSFGAIVSLALATRRPDGLKGLVISGGFAANPVTNPLLRMKIGTAKYLPGPLYRALTLRFHAAALASPYDKEGQVPWSKEKSLELFRGNTPYRSYVARAKAAFSANYLVRLHRINVPTLILTPSHDRLIGRQAAEALRAGIPNAMEVVLPRTGHMFRFSHPETYAAAIENFIQGEVFEERGRARAPGAGAARAGVRREGSKSRATGQRPV
jgi:pimeloyl-ACP methyl ester carboxylesterase